MSVTDYKTFSGKIREKLLEDLSDFNLIQLWFERIITLQYLAAYDIISFNNDYSYDNIIKLCEKENTYFVNLFPNNLDLLKNNYPINFYTSEIITLLQKNINKKTSVEEIINFQEDFKDHERYTNFTSTLRNSDILVTKDNITSVTQIFTPKWIAKFMIENTLNEHDFEKVSILDPCLGAGHLLIVMFDELLKKYKEKTNYSSFEIIKKIYQEQLFGFDIDDVVIRFAKFIFLLKAIKLCPNIEITEIPLPNFIQIRSFNIDKASKYYNLTKKFKDASLVGSLIEINESYEVLNNLNNEEQNLVLLANLLNKKYDIVITNPPYMGRKVLPKDLLVYLNNNFHLGKSELYTSFIERCLNFLKKDGHLAMLTLHTFMFIKSFEGLRRHILTNYQIEKLLHLGKNTFENLNAYNALASVFIIKNKEPFKKALFVKLTDYDNNELKEEGYQSGDNRYILNQKEFLKIEGAPFIYWLTKKEIDILTKSLKLGQFATIRQGLATGDNKNFIRMWYEVPRNLIGFNFGSTKEFLESKKQYAPYNKGGDQTKWYTTSKTLIKFDETSYNKLLNMGNHLPSREYYFKEGITWSLFGFNSFNVRYKEKGYVFDVSGSSLFVDKEFEKYILAFLSSNVAFYFLSSFAPTVNFQVGNIANLPLIMNKKMLPIINKDVEKLIEYAYYLDTQDELSWNFCECEIIKKYDYTKTLKENINYYDKKINLIQQNMLLLEEQLNLIFNDIYGLELDYTPKQKFLSKGYKAYLEEILSYVVGVVFDRYQIKGYKSIIDNTKFVLIDELIKEINKILTSQVIGEIEYLLGYPLKEYYSKYFGKRHIVKYHDLPIYWYKKIDNQIYLGYYHTLKENINIDYNLGIKENYLKNDLYYKLKKEK